MISKNSGASVTEQEARVLVITKVLFIPFFLVQSIICLTLLVLGVEAQNWHKQFSNEKQNQI